MAKQNTTEGITISVPQYILDEVDEICSRTDINRSSFFVRAAKKYIAVHHADSPIFWDYLSRCREKLFGSEKGTY